MHPYNGWLPYKLERINNQLLCRWLYFNTKAFTEPFFDETIAKCKSLAFNSTPFKSFTTLNLLEDLTRNIDAAAPKAIIFHISRCGSTLLSQLLGLAANHLVLSEVPLFDELLRLRYRPYYRQEDYKLYLKAAIKLYPQKRTGTESQLFIKADSWHIFFWRELREMYPDVPFIFLYRSPDEVIRSHQKLRGMQAVPGVIEPEIFGFSENKNAEISLDGYMIQVLEKYFAEFIEVSAKDRLSSLINYSEGPMGMVQKVSEATGINYTKEEWAAIKERSRYNAKHPHLAFSENGRAEILPSLKTVNSLYTKLERIRLKNQCPNFSSINE